MIENNTNDALISEYSECSFYVITSSLSNFFYRTCLFSVSAQSRFSCWQPSVQRTQL